MPMTEQALRALLDLLDELHDGTNSRKVADATLIVRRAVRARLSRVTRQPRIPSTPLYYPDASVDPAQLDFVTGQTPTAVDNPVGTVEDRLASRVVASPTALEGLTVPVNIPVVVDSSLGPGEAYLVNTRTGQRVRIDREEVTTDGEADEEGREGEALLTD